MNEPTKLDRPPCVCWGVYIIEGNRLRRPGLVGPEEELVLLAVVKPAAARVTVELYRGEVLRDRQEWTPAAIAGESVLAVRLGRNPTSSGSTRLGCRLLVNGREIGRRTVLLGAPEIDAQGRFASTPTAAPGQATRLAFVQLLEDTFRAADGE